MRWRLVVAVAVVPLLAGVASAGKSNLIVTAVDGPTTAIAGATITVNSTVQNAGAFDTLGNFFVGVYLSPLADFDPSDPGVVYLGQWEVTTILAALGGEASDATDVVVPLSMPNGAYYLGVFADIGVAENETVTDDNDGVAAEQITISGGVTVDLVITSVSAPATGDLGGTIDVDSTVKNEGDAAVPEFSVGIYASLDATIDPSDPADILLGAWVVTGGLDSGASSSDITTVNIPLATPVDWYYVGAYADHLDDVVEGNEDNNARTSNLVNIGGAAPLPDTTTPFDGGCGGPVSIALLAAFVAVRCRRRGSDRWA